MKFVDGTAAVHPGSEKSKVKTIFKKMNVPDNLTLLTGYFDISDKLNTLKQKEKRNKNKGGRRSKNKSGKKEMVNPIVYMRWKMSRTEEPNVIKGRVCHAWAETGGGMDQEEGNLMH